MYSGNQGFYSSVQLMPKSMLKLNHFCVSVGLNDLSVDGHCTVMHSFNAISLKEALLFKRSRYWAKAIELAQWIGELDGISYLVLKLVSPGLDEEHFRLRQLGCIPDYEMYNPHVTIVSDICASYAKKFCVKANNILQNNQLELVFGNQTIEDLI